MVITFDQGFNELGNKILSKKQEGEKEKTETPWEQYQRRRKEKKKLKQLGK